MVDSVLWQKGLSDLNNDVFNHQEEPGTAYGSLWPIKYKVDKNGRPVHGTLSFDPGAGMIGGLARSAKELLTVPGQVASGARPVTADLGPRLGMDMLNLGTGAGALNPVKGSIAGMFVSGEKPELANLLSEAKEMEGKAFSPQEIHQFTGMFRGGDGNWRYEVPDTKARLRTENLTPSRYGTGNLYMPGQGRAGDDPRLDDILSHPKLFALEPSLKDIKVGHPPLNELGWYTGAYYPEDDEMAFAGGEPHELLKTVLHETQHAADTRAGFQNGGNVEQFLPKGVKDLQQQADVRDDLLSQKAKASGYDYNTLKFALRSRMAGYGDTGHEGMLRQAQHEPWMDQLIDHVSKLNAIDLAKTAAANKYRNLGGEVMARNVENRLPLWQGGYAQIRSDTPPPSGYTIVHFPPGSGNLVHPSTTEDVPLASQIWGGQTGVKSGSAGEGKVPFQLIPGEAAEHNGNFPLMVQDSRTGQYHGIFPSRDEALHYIVHGKGNDPRLQPTYTGPKEQEQIRTANSQMWHKLASGPPLTEQEKYDLALAKQREGKKK